MLAEQLDGAHRIRGEADGEHQPLGAGGLGGQCLLEAVFNVAADREPPRQVIEQAELLHQLNVSFPRPGAVAPSQLEQRRAQRLGNAARPPDDVEIWQIAALDCNEDRNAARGKVGAMLAFLAGYVIGDKHLETRGVPEPLRAPLLELRRRYSTRPGAADIKLVDELGLFDYLSRRLSICGNPQDCLDQTLAAKAAGAKRLMLTVSLASDPVRTVELFGEHVLPKL